MGSGVSSSMALALAGFCFTPPSSSSSSAPASRGRAHSGSLRPGGEALAPLMEDPGGGRGRRVWRGVRTTGWVQTVGPRPPVLHPADGRRRVVPPLRLLLDIMGAALASVSASATEPLPHLSVHGAPIVSRISVSSVRELRLGKCGSNFVFCSNAGGRARSGVSRCRRPRRCSTSCSSTWRHRPAQGAGGRRRPALPRGLCAVDAAISERRGQAPRMPVAGGPRRSMLSLITCSIRRH